MLKSASGRLACRVLSCQPESWAGLPSNKLAGACPLIGFSSRYLLPRLRIFTAVGAFRCCGRNDQKLAPGRSGRRWCRYAYPQPRCSPWFNPRLSGGPLGCSFHVPRELVTMGGLLVRAEGRLPAIRPPLERPHMTYLFEQQLPDSASRLVFLRKTLCCRKWHSLPQQKRGTRHQSQ